MVAKGKTLSNGHETVDPGEKPSRALEVAQGGIRTTKDIANFSLAHSLDTLQGVIGTKEANASLRGVTTALRAIETGHRVGQNKEVCGI